MQDITFFATRDAVTVEDPEARVLGRWGLTDFYDAIPQSPDRGTAKIEHGGRSVVVECAIREWQQFNSVLDELIDCREFIPLEDWINQHCDHEDLIRTFNLLKSLS